MGKEQVQEMKMAAYLEACLEESNGDAVFVAKALGIELHAAPLRN